MAGDWTKDGLQKRILNMTIYESENYKGHALAKHDGIKKNELKERCLKEKKRATSFFENKIEDYVIKTLSDENYQGGNIHYILVWINDYNWDDDFCIELKCDTATGYGYQYNKRNKSADYIVCNGVTVILRKLEKYNYVPFKVVTAYPCIIK